MEIGCVSATSPHDNIVANVNDHTNMIGNIFNFAERFILPPDVSDVGIISQTALTADTTRCKVEKTTILRGFIAHG